MPRAKTYTQWLRPKAPDDPRRCVVCGHRSVTPVRHSLNWLIAALLGAALCYIAIDVAEDGHLDGRVWRALTFAAHHGPTGQPSSRPPQVN
jgi:hypothetical protein